jgi:1,4-alpha-glucan branching enzyme
MYREWAPAARSLHLIGDFNDWNRQTHPMQRDRTGVWSIFLPDAKYAEPLRDGDWVKVHVDSAIGPMRSHPGIHDAPRLATIPRPTTSPARYWHPPTPYTWQHATAPARAQPRIYEAHVGMAHRGENGSATYREFTDNVLPRIARGRLQRGAAHGHPGAPLLRLVRLSGQQLLRGVLALRHARRAQGSRRHRPRPAACACCSIWCTATPSRTSTKASTCFDGSDHQYFHAGGRGEHPAWDSMLL